MKTIYQLICALCVICGICACDDFLDTDNLTMKDTSNFPLNETDAVQMVNGIYSVMNRNLADPEEDPFFIFDIASDDRLGGGSQSNIGAQGVDRLMNAYVDWMKPLWKSAMLVSTVPTMLWRLSTTWRLGHRLSGRTSCSARSTSSVHGTISTSHKCLMVCLWSCPPYRRTSPGLRLMRYMPRLPPT